MSYGVGLNNQHRNGPEEPKPDAKDVAAEGLRKKNTYDQIQHAKVGALVAYTKGQGKIVKKDGAYVTIFNEEANAYDQVHIGETYLPGDTISMGIMNQLWDQMQSEVRMGILHKANIQEPLHFVSRSWNELPESLKEVLKKSPSYVSVGSGVKDVPEGAHKDPTPKERREAQGITPKKKPKKETPKKESKSPEFVPGRTIVNPKPGSKPESKPAGTPRKLSDRIAQRGPKFTAGILTAKSDVEHGAYGGVSTDTSFDADEEYEEDHREGKRTQIKYDENKKPENHKEDGDEVMIGFHEKSIRNKYNTRYGPRQVTKEEGEAFLEKKGPKKIYTQSREGQKDKLTPAKEEGTDPGDVSGGKSRGSSTRTIPKGPSAAAGMSSVGGKREQTYTSYRGQQTIGDRVGSPDKSATSPFNKSLQLAKIRAERLLKAEKFDLSDAGDRKELGRKFTTTQGKPLPGSASSKPMSQTMNPTGSKTTHRTREGTIGAKQESALNTGSKRTFTPGGKEKKPKQTAGSIIPHKGTRRRGYEEVADDEKAKLVRDQEAEKIRRIRTGETQRETKPKTPRGQAAAGYAERRSKDPKPKQPKQMAKPTKDTKYFDSEGEPTTRTEYKKT